MHTVTDYAIAWFIVSVIACAGVTLGSVLHDYRARRNIERDL